MEGLAWHGVLVLLGGRMQSFLEAMPMKSHLRRFAEWIFI